MNIDKRFEFIAGSPALCFVDTFGDRNGQGKERLTEPKALCDWLMQAGLWAQSASRVTDETLEHARLLREAIFRCGISVIRKQPFSQADLDLLNRVAAKPPFRPQLHDGELVLVSPHPVEAALSVLAADALHLLSPPLSSRIRQCPGCAMMFIDNSRPGRRRWCSSAQGCGNREKVRSLRARRALEKEKE